MLPRASTTYRSRLSDYPIRLPVLAKISQKILTSPGDNFVCQQRELEEATLFSYKHRRTLADAQTRRYRRLRRRERMTNSKSGTPWSRITLLCICALPLSAQSFRVQCPTSTITHPAASNNSEPGYTGPTQFATNAQGFQAPTTGSANGAIKCQQISGGDGYATMAD